VVLCRMGYMLMADPATALRESARVLNEGGRLALAVWADADANPWGAVPMRAVIEHFGAPGPPPGAPGLWALADETHLHNLLADAGLGAVRREMLDDEVECGSVDELIELTGRLAGPGRALFASPQAVGRAPSRAPIAHRG